MKIARAVLIGMLILLPCNSFAHNNKKDEQVLEELNKSPVILMANKIESNRDKLEKLGLKQKNKKDIIETLNIIREYTKDDEDFTFEQIVSIAIVESGLDRKAKNNTDKGMGLLMVMQKYWRKELPWYNNPYNKNQSIKAGIAALNIIKKREGCSSWEAIRYYNSKNHKSKKYIAKIRKIHNLID